jgi:hypothetical protein
MYHQFLAKGENEDGGQWLPLVRCKEEAILSRGVNRTHRIGAGTRATCE